MVRAIFDLDDGGHTAQGTGRVKRAAERETGVFGVTKEQGQAHEDQRDVEEAGAVNGRGATGGRLRKHAGKHVESYPEMCGV
jgi:hypothetical protein